MEVVIAHGDEFCDFARGEREIAIDLLTQSKLNSPIGQVTIHTDQSPLKPFNQWPQGSLGVTDLNPVVAFIALKVHRREAMFQKFFEMIMMLLKMAQYYSARCQTSNLRLAPSTTWAGPTSPSCSPTSI